MSRQSEYRPVERAAKERREEITFNCLHFLFLFYILMTLLRRHYRRIRARKQAKEGGRTKLMV